MVAGIPLNQYIVCIPIPIPRLKAIRVRIARNGRVNNVVDVVAAESVVMPEEPNTILLCLINLIVFDQIEIAADLKSVVGGFIRDGKTTHNIIRAGDVYLLRNDFSIGLQGYPVLSYFDLFIVRSRTHDACITRNGFTDTFLYRPKRCGRCARIGIVAGCGYIIDVLRRRNWSYRC